MANCSVEGRGSLFDWDVTDDWDLGNETDSEDFEFSRLCERDTFKVTNFMLPFTLMFVGYCEKSHNTYCDTYGIS